MQISSLFPAFTNTRVQGIKCSYSKFNNLKLIYFIFIKVEFWDGNQRAACGQIIADLI